MGRRWQALRTSIARHGIWWTLVRYGDARLRRVLQYELCQVLTNDELYGSGWELADYETRSLDEQRFHAMLCEELRDVDYRWAFARGDFCIASISGAEVVGFTFYTNQMTPVAEGLQFCFPHDYLYAYGSITAPAHRGNRLESTRWKAAQAHVIRSTGTNPPRIFYVDVLNLESRAANRRSAPGNRLLGYSAYLRVPWGWLCWSSRGARRLGAGFRRTPTVPSGDEDP